MDLRISSFKREAMIHFRKAMKKENWRFHRKFVKIIYIVQSKSSTNYTNRELLKITLRKKQFNS